jgi:hypothetical protein
MRRPAPVFESCGSPGRRELWYVADALRAGMTRSTRCTNSRHRSLVPGPDRRVGRRSSRGEGRLTRALTRCHAWLKRKGFSDARLANCWVAPRSRRYATAPGARHAPGLQARRYLRRGVRVQHRLPVLDLRGGVRGGADRPRRRSWCSAGGPNRIGQGIEFDYCCVHAALALREDGYETIMVNCNPETVSTDYDTSDRLYFEPLTLEDVLEIVESSSRRRDRAVRRPDPAEAGARPGAGRRADHRHLARCHRSGRGPRALPACLEDHSVCASRPTHRAQRERGAGAGG